MEEYEEYSVYANAPYLLHEGHSIEDVEKEIFDYGLTGKIDPDLTDDLSTTIVKDDKVIHSVRGTATLKDIWSDIGIAFSHPAVQSALKGLNTIGAIYGINFDNFIIPIQQNIAEEVTKLTPEFYKNQLYSLTDWQEYMTAVAEDPNDVLPEWNYIEWMEEIKSVEQKLKKAKNLQKDQTFWQNFKSFFTLGLQGVTSLYSKRHTEENRIGPEIEKLEKIKQKYPNKEIELTGHSLGSVVNVLGRKEGIKTITFNPAPQFTKGEHHPSSKIYRTKYDPVSYFLSWADNEPVIEINAKENLDSHTIMNFYPRKPSSIVKKEPKEPEEPYCRKNPDDPNCKIFRT